MTKAQRAYKHLKAWGTTKHTQKPVKPLTRDVRAVKAHVELKKVMDKVKEQVK